MLPRIEIEHVDNEDSPHELKIQANNNRASHRRMLEVSEAAADRSRATMEVKTNSMELDTSVVFIVSKDNFRFKIQYPSNALQSLGFYQVLRLNLSSLHNDERHCDPNSMEGREKNTVYYFMIEI